MGFSFAIFLELLHCQNYVAIQALRKPSFYKPINWKV